MEDLVRVGFGNYISPGRISMIASPDTAPIQRLVRQAKEDGVVIDMTNGRRTQGVIFLDTGVIGLVGLSLGQLAARGVPVPQEYLVRRKRSRRA